MSEVIILILLALGLAVIAWRQEDWNSGVRILIMFGSILFLSLAIVAAVVWIEFNMAVVAEQRQRAAACSERVRYAIELKNLSPEQLAAIGKFVPATEIISGTQGRIELWRCVNGGLIPNSFIRRYINRGDDNFLYPVRNLTDEDRETANLFIADIVQRGWASAASGSRPARWIEKDEAILQIFGSGGL